MYLFIHELNVKKVTHPTDDYPELNFSHNARLGVTMPGNKQRKPAVSAGFLPQVLSFEMLTWAASLSPHRTVIYGTTVNLTRLREITPDLAQLFGLALPVPLEKRRPRDNRK